MDTAVTIFQREDFGEVRTAMLNGEAYFMLADVCRVLEIGNPSDVAPRLNPSGVDIIEVSYPSGAKKATFCNEANLYRVIFQSRKPQAEKFIAWVTEEVLPAIRKTGSFSLVPRTFQDALRQLADEVDRREQLEAQNLLMAPKADFYDAVAGSKDAVPIGNAAKVLEVPGVGRNNLFKILREQNILQRDNIPYQEYVDRGYFRVIEQKFMVEGEPRISFKTLVYQRGLEYIRNLLLKLSPI